MRTCSACKHDFIDAQDVCPLDETRLDPPNRATAPIGVGRTLGSYRLICLLGEGGMGNIYIAAHTRLNRYAAIKVLRPELQHRKDAITRFFEEARAINRIKHPNIIESIDLVEDVVDGAYCVLELLHGVSLKQWLDAGRMPLDSAVRIAAQLADALQAVHSLDIVHRDLKPDNLILIHKHGRKDHVKLIDFGVAQMSHDGSGAGTPIGTAAYMAPEQAAGEVVDGRADVYALGVLLFEMVTGFHPFPSSNDAEFTLRHADDPAPRPSKVERDIEVPKELDAIILRCLEKRPQDRYPDAAAVTAALRDLDVRPRKKRTGLVVSLGLLAGFGAVAALYGPELYDRYLADHPAPQPAVAVTPPAPEPPPPPPATPEMVTLSFTSTPSGAKVFREGESIALGVTPFSTNLVRADKATPVRFELGGYEPVTIDASLEHGGNVEVTLEPAPPETVPEPARPRPATKKSKPEPQREGVIDPFATKN